MNRAFAFVCLAVLARPCIADDTERSWYYVDFGDKANQKLDENMHASSFEENNLKDLPRGEQALGDVKFQIGDALLQVRSKALPDFPEKIEGLQVDLPVARLIFLHATGFQTQDGAEVGSYVVHYADSTQETITIKYGEDVRDWWDTDGSAKVTRGKEAWRGTNPPTKAANAAIRLYLLEWENPHPDKDVSRIDFVSANDPQGAPFCVAITAEVK